MCGIIGMMANNPVSLDLYDGLIVLQHRGQDAAGIATYDGQQIHLKRGNGMVRDVFRTRNMERLTGNMGIGHVRYPTAGCANEEEAQPFYVNAPFGIALGHNGNLTNYKHLRKEVVEKNKRHLNTFSDSEVLLNILAFEFYVQSKGKNALRPKDIFTALKRVYKRIAGGYAVVSMIGQHGILAFRDPNGIRPLTLGVRKGGTRPEYAVASESVALEALGFEIMRDIQPGEAVYIDLNHNLHFEQCAPSNSKSCIFEYVYLARPDSLVDDVSVYKARLRMGTALAKQIAKDKIKIDVVIPIPETSRPVAITIADALGVPYREGFVKNRYIGRTFIMPNQALRKKSVRYKLNPIELEFRKKNVLLVDDSIVRGTTCKQIIDMTREAGAKKVYFASAAPMLINPCVYGIDMPTRNEFIANKLSHDQIAKLIGADKLYYQNIKDLIQAVRAGNPKLKNFCYACMGGPYPAGNITEDVLQRVEKERFAYQTAQSTTADNQMSLL